MGSGPPRNSIVTTLVHHPHIGRFGRTGAAGRAMATRSPDSVPLHDPRCDLGLGKTRGLPPVTSCEVKTRALVQIFPGDRETPAQCGLRALGGRDKKDRLTVS